MGRDAEFCTVVGDWGVRR